jgi:hypothetical protein
MLIYTLEYADNFFCKEGVYQFISWKYTSHVYFWYVSFMYEILSQQFPPPDFTVVQAFSSASSLQTIFTGKEHRFLITCFNYHLHWFVLVFSVYTSSNTVLSGPHNAKLSCEVSVQLSVAIFFSVASHSVR